MLTFRILIFSAVICSQSAGAMEIIAHRGVHQSLGGDVASHEKDIAWDACTAGMIEKTNHLYIENTIPSIRAAFENGATVVEIDFHRTSDNKIVLFHDFYLNCRTDAIQKGCRSVDQKGQQRCLIWQQSLGFLKSLDPGYSYSFDNGKTFPIRGKWKGHIPELQEVLKTFPDRKFLLDYKGDDGDTLPLIAKILNDYSVEVRNRIYWYNLNEEKQKRVRELIPGTKILIAHKKQIKKCSLWYATTGWFGYVPQSCKSVSLAIPYKYFTKLGGLTNRFVKNIHKHGSSIIVAFVETPEQAMHVKKYPVDGVFTNHIQTVGTYLK